MTIIAEENHYQKKVWAMGRADSETRKEMAQKTPEEIAIEQEEHSQELKRLRKDVEDVLARTILKPSPWLDWKFKHATAMALAAAENLELDVRVETNGGSGYITFAGDMILTEANIWHDNREKRQLLRTINWAESVFITTTEEYGQQLLVIQLTYKLFRERITRKR